ncbi:TetR/AcrR family transcriptional regulator [Cellulomonas sp. SLBN-39]|uniref:TetR/AcrR family transcriptional regulator n=1 Tax=Cellulomonas sp. SLBN-39 TaxID=2768446 RepID=UPI001172FDF7|nr:TetR/AcrR family transcriptional regulator [Cellulomonas sp. SLBN-39]TQL03951.1 TetR family transcriptional regulator [Cellulomonas sp. SLBN-39]
MPTDQRTGRAAPLPPAERRRAILRAVRPVVAERGLEVTTRELAEAAGVAEGTLFRVFADKRALLREAALDAADASEAVADLAAIDASAPLERRLCQVVEVTVARVERVMVWMSLVHRLGPDDSAHEDAAQAHRAWAARQRDARAAVHDELARLLAPDAARLRMPVADAVELLDALLLGVVVRGEQDRRRGVDAQPLAPARLVDLLLHGVLADTAPAVTDTPPAPDRKDGADPC